MTIYGMAMIAASGPGHGVASIARPATSQRPTASLTVRRAPMTVAMEPMPACRSGSMSWTAPKAWAAIPQRKKAASRITSPGVTSAPASAKPTTAGLTKCVLDVSESKTGRSLKRSPATE
ncbi:hypothetical protein D3C73_1319300 [compost metagenome]